MTVPSGAEQGGDAAGVDLGAAVRADTGPGTTGGAVHTVFLVGAGPGDPDLLTLKGVRCLEQAEVVLYDRLVDPALLELAPREVELVYVGKRSAQHTVPQEGINQLLVDYALAGKKVVRLKGGDPFVFGRGGEEALALRRAGVPYEVVPGITSGVGAPAYAGIPVTHRGYTSHVTFVTGHEDPTKQEAHIDWDKLASDVGTLVIFMGVKNLPKVVQELTKRGRPGSTPIALIRYGTWPDQRTVAGTLDDIVERVAAAGLRPPAITVVGDVVKLREELHWFEDRPLFGRRVVVTRPRTQAALQIKALRDLGAEVVAFPTIRIEPLAGSPEIETMLSRLDQYDLVVFTSVNAVDCFFDRLRDAGADARRLSRASVVAVGPKTSAACRARGVIPDLVPKTYLAEGILQALKERAGAADAGAVARPATEGRAGEAETGPSVSAPTASPGFDMTGVRVLFPRAREARELLPEALAAAGASIDVVTLYETLPVDHAPERVDDALDADYVTFTSASSAESFAALLRRDGRADALAGVRAASIGPITSEAIRAAGMTLVVEATEFTVEGLVAALVSDATTLSARGVPGRVRPGPVM